MANYQATADAIYSPQQQSEASVLERGKATQEQGLNEESQTIDPYYNDAIKGATKQRAAEGANQDLLYSTALSGQGSGLQGNQQRLLGENLIEATGKLEGERVQKKGNIATRRRMIGDDYTAGMSSLAAKYSGLKSAFITDSQRRDEDINREATQRAQDRSFAVSQQNSANAFSQKMAQMQIDAQKAAQPSSTQVLADLFTGYIPAGKGGKRGFTESSVIPAFMAKSGMSRADATKVVYGFRKQNFGE